MARPNMIIYHFISPFTWVYGNFSFVTRFTLQASPYGWIYLYPAGTGMSISEFYVYVLRFYGVCVMFCLFTCLLYSRIWYGELESFLEIPGVMDVIKISVRFNEPGEFRTSSSIDHAYSNAYVEFQ